MSGSDPGIADEDSEIDADTEFDGGIALVGVDPTPPPAGAKRPARDEAGKTPVLSAASARVREFDLSRQETIERGRLRRLQPLFETIAHRIGSSLTAAIRQPASVELATMEQSTWEETAAKLPDPTYVTSALLLPLDGRVVMHLPVALVLEIIDFYLGGDGTNEPERDQLTDIERVIMTTITEVIWNEVPPPFSTIIALEVEFIQHSASATLVQVGRPGVMCLIVELGVTLGDGATHAVQLALPLTVLLPVLEQMEQAQSSTGANARVDKKEARRRILAVPVELKVSYPRIDLTPAELLSLQVGDVVPLGQPPANGPSPLQLLIQDTFFGTGVLVENGNKLTVMVATKRETEDE